VTETPGASDGANATVLADTLEVFAWPDRQSYALGQLTRGQRVTLSHRWAGKGDWLAIPGAGWIASSPSSPAVSLDASASNLPESFERVRGPTHPFGTGTGTPDVDRVIAAVSSGDASAVDALLDFQQVNCSAVVAAPGGVECPAGVDDGALVEVFSRSVYEADASPVLKNDQGSTIADVIKLDRDAPPSVYAAAVVRDMCVLRKCYASLEAVFFSNPSGSGFTLLVDVDGRIVHAVAGGQAGELFHFLGSDEITLAPALPALLDPS
jgi:hypothetical protein